MVSSAAITFLSTPTSGTGTGGRAQGQACPDAQPAVPAAVSIRADAVSTRRRVGSAATEPPADRPASLPLSLRANAPASGGQPPAVPRIG
jgi:hypothetical protein